MSNAGKKKKPKSADEKARHKIYNPHDSYFQTMMSEPTVYRDLIKKYVPNYFLRNMDLRTIKPSKTHFVDERLRHLYSDCLYTVKLKGGGEVYIYILVEHQSASDYWMPLRLREYADAAWKDVKRHVKGKKVKLPLVIPLVIYNGEKPYRHSLDIRDMFNGTTEMIEAALFKPATLVDLNKIEDEQLKEDIHLGSMMLTLKHAFDKVMPYEKIIIQLSKIKSPRLKWRFLLAALHYIFNVRKDVDENELKDIVTERISAKAGVEVMTLAERLKKKGREEGEKKGVKKGIKKGIKDGLLIAARNLLKAGSDEKFG